MKNNPFVLFTVIAIILIIFGAIATVTIINSDLPDFMKYLLLK